MKLYHVSPRKIIKGIPKLPNSSLAKQGYEENKTKRFSVSPSIKKCLLGKSMPLKDKELYVYEIKPTKKIRSITNHKIVSDKLVPDAKITGERWILDPVRLKCVGKIKVIDSVDKGISYKYGKNKTAKLYGWKYKFIKK